jgi:IS4 transposase
MHCLSCGADYIFRLKHNAFFHYGINGNKINLNEKLSQATETENVDISAYFKKGNKLIPVRICAIKKKADDIEKTKTRTKKRESRKCTIYSDDSKLMNNYIVVVTSLPLEISANDILELYRYRWQIELFFKRAKSLLLLGNLPNKKEENIIAWLNGKMLCAILVELIQAKVDFFPQECSEP